jgi:HupE / UreJ protein
MGPGLALRAIRGWVFGFAFVLAFALATPASAHTRSQSQSAWSIEGDRLYARVEVDAVDVTRLYALGGEQPPAALFAEEASRAFAIAAGGRACTQNGAASAGAGAPGRISASLSFICPSGALAGGEVEIASRLFLRVAPSHLHFVAMRDESGRAAEAVLTESTPRARLTLSAAPKSFWEALTRFFPIGAIHVWSGLDHIAFMLALVLLAGGRLRAAVLAATGFTIGHTLTLGLAAVGVLQPDTTAIEALIGFTIAFVALAIGADGAGRMRVWSAPLAAALACGGVAASFDLLAMSPLIWFGLATFVFAYPRGFPRDAPWLAAIFGLIHGCGFAGALSDLELPQPRLLASLLGFNLGVEAAQIVIIGGALGLGAVATRLPMPSISKHALPVAAALLFGLGAFWFVARLL